ncbi:MAG: ATP-binding protein, partial [Planctomycetota bacterium]
AWQEARRLVHERTYRMRTAVERHEAATAKLDEARAEATDDALAVALAEAERKRDASERAYSFAVQEHEKREPQRVRESAEEARRAMVAAGTRLQKAHRERDTLQGRLEARGEDGLHESLERARTALAAAERDRTALDRRAAAARLLFETMRDAREAAQRSYAGPLRDRIVELGRLVYGDAFDVELDDELRIASRTLDGVTLPFESLSVGAREQLGLLARLATALTVDEKDGVPLILDDTLGYSDAGRLDGMAKVLAKAGERCQVLVLTSSPERFAGIERAKRIALA